MKLLPLLIILLLITVSVLLGCHKIVDPDIGWHLTTARMIISELALPETDPFSYTSPKESWVNHEYLSEVILLGFYNLFGPVGLNIYNILLAIFFVIILLDVTIHHRKDQIRKSIGFFLVTVGILAVHPRFLARPDFLNILMAAIYIWILEKGNSRWFKALPILQVLWVNLHGGFVIGVLLACSWVTTSIFSILFNKKREVRLHVDKMLIALSVPFVSLLNPYGLKGVLHPFEQVRLTVFTETIQEWISPFAAIQNTGLTPHLLAYAFLLITGISSLAFRSGRSPAYRIIALPSLAILSLSSVRHIPLVIPIAVVTATTGLPTMNLRCKAISPFFRILAFCSAAGLAISIPTNILYRAEKTTQQFGCGFSNLAIGYESASFLVDSEFEPNLINSYDLGGTVILRAYPTFKVFIDGRNLVYGPHFYKEYLSIIKGNTDPVETRERYDWRTAIIKHNSTESVVLLPYLASSDQWGLAFLDEAAAIFKWHENKLPNHLRKSRFDAAAAPWTGMNLVKAEQRGNGLPFAGLNLAGFFIQCGRPDLAEQVYALLFSLYPKNMELRYNLGTILLAVGKLEASTDLFIEAAEAGYQAPGLERKIAEMLYRSGRNEKAESWYRKAVRASRKDSKALIGLARILRKDGKLDESRKVVGQALRVVGSNPDLLAQLGKEAYLTGEGDTALFCFEEALSESPLHEEALVGYAKLLQNSGEIDQARDILDKAVKTHPKSLKVIHAYGALLKADGDFTALRSFYTANLEKFPNNGGIAYNLGLVSLKYFDQRDSAKYWFEIAIDNLEPGTPPAVEATRILERLSKTTP